MDQDGARGDLVVDEDTCLGDSGSPMIIPRGGEDVQVDNSQIFICTLL